MKLWIAIVVLMLATVGHAGNAGVSNYFTGNEMLELCESDDFGEREACHGFLAGIADVSATYDGLADFNSGFCIPGNVSVNQLRRIVIKGLNAEPEELHLDASALVVGIFRAAFFCITE